MAEDSMAEEFDSTAPEASDGEMAQAPSQETPPQETASREVSSREVSSRNTTGRPFRVKLRGSVLVLVQLPNRRSIRAALHQLSVTGGVIHLEKPLDEKVKVEVAFHIGGATVREKAEMLFPMWATQGWMQPFRFVDVSEADRAALDSKLKTFLGESAQGATAGV